MNEINNGGPAFARYGLSTQGNDGMSLRDWFAGQALAGLLAGFKGPTCPWVEDETPEPVTTRAYGIADAMLKARAAK